jgi:hypothetical protein
MTYRAYRTNVTNGKLVAGLDEADQVISLPDARW